VWDAVTSRQLRVMRHEKWVRAMAVSPDGRYIASSSLDDTVRLWEAASGKEIYRLPGHGDHGGIRAIAFSADGRRFASWGDDWYLRVWDVRTGKALSEVRIRPSGREIKESDEDDTGAGRHEENFDLGVNLAELVHGAQRLLISFDYGRVVYVFDVPSGKELRKLESEEFQDISLLAVSPNGKLLLTIGRKTTLKLKDGVRPLAAQNQSILLRELQTGRIIWKQDLPTIGPGAVTFSSDGKQMAASLPRTSNEIRVWDVETHEELARIKDVPGITWSRSLAFSPDGKWLGCGQRNTSVLIWDLQRLARNSKTD
jgi:WD40 repeat protein